MEFYEEVCRRTAQLVAGWQSVGFTHGQSTCPVLCTVRHEKRWTVQGLHSAMMCRQAALIP